MLVVGPTELLSSDLRRELGGYLEIQTVDQTPDVRRIDTALARYCDPRRSRPITVWREDVRAPLPPCFVVYQEALVEGVAEGALVDRPRGRAGFGYDPVFWAPEVGKTFAELSPEEKGRLSHRGVAVRGARTTLDAWARRQAAQSA